MSNSFNEDHETNAKFESSDNEWKELLKFFKSGKYLEGGCTAELLEDWKRKFGSDLKEWDTYKSSLEKCHTIKSKWVKHSKKMTEKEQLKFERYTYGTGKQADSDSDCIENTTNDKSIISKTEGNDCDSMERESDKIEKPIVSQDKSDTVEKERTTAHFLKKSSKGQGDETNFEKTKQWTPKATDQSEGMQYSACDKQCDVKVYVEVKSSGSLARKVMITGSERKDGIFEWSCNSPKKSEEEKSNTIEELDSKVEISQNSEEKDDLECDYSNEGANEQEHKIFPNIEERTEEVAEPATSNEDMRKGIPIKHSIAAYNKACSWVSLLSELVNAIDEAMPNVNNGTIMKNLSEKESRKTGKIAKGASKDRK